MRTTINIDDGLLADAKQLAASNGRTLTALIEEALRERVLRARDRQRRPQSQLPVSRRTGGLAPGIDLDDTASLLDSFEQDVPLDKRR